MEELENTIEDDVIDIEDYVSAGKEVPKAQRYRIRIDKEKFIVGPSATGRQLLLLAGKKPPERFRIDQKFHGGQTKRIELDEVVDFTKPGIERFMTMPLDQTDGEPRRQFLLPLEDTEHLEARGLAWETINAEGGPWLILHDYSLIPGYNHQKIDIAINIISGYPIAALDMIYVYPALALANGKGIGGLTPRQIDGKIWQQWSRHRTAQNPWRAGLDCIATHLALAEWWFEKEARTN